MDLSRIPEPLRSRLSEQLDQLPPDVRGRLEQQLSKLPLNQLDALLQRNAALLQRLAGQKPKPATHKTSTSSPTAQAPKPRAVFDPHDHYNNTIRRGDSQGPPLFEILFLVACGFILLQVFG